MSETIEKIIILGEVTIQAIASDEDPYGQGGFSAVTGKIVVSDGESAAALKKSYKEKTPIVVRCGGLELEGVVSRYNKRLFGAKIVLWIDRIASFHKDKPRPL